MMQERRKNKAGDGVATDDSIESSDKPIESSANSIDGSYATTNTGKGATLLILTQIVSKLFTFLLNQLLVRAISPTLFGISSYLDFLYSTILFFSREAERASIQRTKPLNDLSQTYQSIINFGYIPIIIGIPISILILGWQSRSETFKEVNLLANYFNHTVALFWLSIILELIIEPIYSLNQYTLNFSKRSKYEGLSVFLRCVSSVVMVLSINSPDSYERNGLILLSFGLGQLIYSFTLFVCYFRNSYNYKINRFPSRLENKSYLDMEVLKFWRISFIQMIFKQLLTEGDKFLVNSFFSVEERGVYSVMSNYGSIIVRLLFQPIEESVRLSFTRTLTQAKSAQTKSHLFDALKTVKLIFIFYLQLSIVIFLGGFFNGSFLLKFLLGGKSSNWSQTDLFDIFPYYIIYIPFLAFNGVLEGVLMSIANPKQTKYHLYFMTFSSIVILFISYILIGKCQLGILGLILANIFNMTFRIIYSIIFIDNFFINNDIKFDHLQIVTFLVKHLIIVVIGFYTNYYIGKTNSFKDLIISGIICLTCLTSMLLLISKELTAILKRFYKKQA